MNALSRWAVLAMFATGAVTAVAPAPAPVAASVSGPDSAPRSISASMSAPAPAPRIPGDYALIRRDTFGVPHILASSEALAAEAHGYATAEDHFDLLARAFLRARGERAMHFGEEFAKSDLLAKRLRIHEEAADRFGSLPAAMRGILDGYAAGYNRYLAEHRADLPSWAPTITGVDVLAHCRAVVLLDFALNLRQWERAAANAAAPAASPAPPTPSSRDGEPDAEALGSNGWALGKGRSASGRGILLANPHLLWSGNFLFHEVQITVPKQINVYGATLIGFPVVAIGFNEFLGWTHTVNAIDADDVYELTVDPADASRYLFDGQPRAFDDRTVSIQVKTAAGLETRTEHQLWSHLGPVLRPNDRKAFAFKSANLDQVGFLTQWNAMGKAQSLRAFQAALEQQALPMFNIVYADRAGNAFYLFDGRIPRRNLQLQANWSGVVPGDRSAYEWTGIHPLADLPQLLNPPGGYVQNCNDAPWYTTPHARVDPARYPAYMAGNGMNLRGQSSVRILESDPRITLDEVTKYKFDTRLLAAERTKDDLLALAGEANDAALEPAIALLRSWDNRADADSRGAVLFHRWWTQYSSRAKPIARVPWTAENPYATPTGIGDKAAALASLRAAVSALQRDHGRIDVPWGDLYRFRRGAVDLPLGGAPSGDGVFRVVGFEADRDGRSLGVSGDSFVLAVEFSDAVKAYSVLTYSESSDPRSPHYNDQSDLFVQARMKPVWFTERAIQAHLERSYDPRAAVRSDAPLR